MDDESKLKGKPKLFIGSSSEGLDVAEVLQLALERDCETRVWPQGAFGQMQGNLAALVAALEKYDFAVLVATPDDMLERRGAIAAVPRDNVIFELGLFMGRLGSDRTFLVFDRTKPIQLPSDLSGVTLADYEPQSAGDLRNSVALAATKIRLAMKDCGPRRDIHTALADVKQTVIASGETGPDEQTYFDKLSQVVDGQKLAGVTLLYADVDKLRSVTRQIFLEERERRDVTARRLGRRPESEIRSDFLVALNISFTDAIYQLRSDGLKHDIFQLPDPDVAVIARDLSYDDALDVAKRTQESFLAEASCLLNRRDAAGETRHDGGGPGVTLLVANVQWLRNRTKQTQAAHMHQFLRKQLKVLKEVSGRGRVFGHDDLVFD